MFDFLSKISLFLDVFFKQTQVVFGIKTANFYSLCHFVVSSRNDQSCFLRKVNKNTEIKYFFFVFQISIPVVFETGTGIDFHPEPKFRSIPSRGVAYRSVLLIIYC